MLRFGYPARLAAIMCLFAGLVATSGGCGGGKTTGKVSGQVWLNGKPVTDGEVHFISKKGGGGRGSITGAGAYAVDDPLETGEYTVYVAPHPPGQAGPPGTGKVPRQPASKIPNKYRDPNTSGLSYTIKEGANEYKIEMKG
ncbi:MAG: hypothetical protein IT429_23520 [Gemmataceae bacterium]|nr:hypothetical protein [Gemmataceae bacterium]